MENENKTEKTVGELIETYKSEFDSEPIEIEADTTENNEGVVEFDRLPPWAIAYNRLEAFFEDDSDLDLELDGLARTAIISSDNYAKLDALSKMLEPEIDGLTIKLVNTGFNNEYARTIETALKGNKHLDNVRIATEASTGFKHIITTFKDETIQYKADNRFVPGGYETILAEDLIKEIFRDEYRRSVYVTKSKFDTFLDEYYGEDLSEDVPNFEC